MNKFFKIWLVFLTFGGLLISGCATNVSEITVSLPSPPQMSHQESDRTFFIVSVTDERIFDPAPSDPSVPSLDLNRYDKARAIGRKRNSWGKAMGGFLLKPGQTVELLTEEVIERAARDNGYTVLNSADQIKPNTVKAEVKIKQFWTWMNPGFFTIKLNANMNNDITLESGNRVEQISAQGFVERNCQFGTERNYTVVLNEALIKLYEDMKDKLSKISFNKYNLKEEK